MSKTPRKKVRIMSCGMCDDEDAMQTSVKWDGNILTYDVLRVIFRYLNSMDLSNAAKVCRYWRDAAKMELQSRGPDCFLEHIKFPKKKHYPWRRATTMSFELKGVKNLRIRPVFGLYILTSFKAFSGLRNEEGIPFRLHPNNYTAIILNTVGIIKDNFELENKTASIVCAFLPEIPGVTIQMLPVSSEDQINEYKTLIDTIRNTSMQSNVSTCLMLFSRSEDPSVANDFIKAIRCSNQNMITSLWGGVVKNYVIFWNDQTVNDSTNWEFTSPYNVCAGLLIAGPIQTWSTIVSEQSNTEEQVEANLISWRNKIKLRKYKMGFMFACRGRGTTMFHKTHVESSVFKRLFPNVPLVGCFGDGEFGKYTFLQEHKNLESDPNEQWTNWYSTVFMILTYG